MRTPRRLLLLATVALAAATVLPSQAAEPRQAETVGWSAFANVIVSGVGVERAPTFRVDRLPSPLLSPESIDCVAFFEVQVEFAVTCTTKSRPPTPNNTVTNTAWNCNNPMVKADIAGPAALESVTGTVTCGSTVASCTAIASIPTGVSATNFEGTCTGRGNPGPWPLRCSVDLTRVKQDRWQVTCYSTDP